MMNSTTSLKVRAAAELERRRRAAFKLNGSNLEAWNSTDAEVLISGAAGTGKTRTWLEKLHRNALNYPGMRGLIIRKTRASLSESALVTFEQHVLGLEHPLVTNGPTRQFRQVYSYPNRSQLVVGGMDNPTRIMSTEYDVIYVPEAIELSKVEWESLSTRLRNGVMPYQQLCADTNPSYPDHWLKQRCDSGTCRLIFARHEDNPYLYNIEKGEWTPIGRDYIARLDGLTGVEKERLRFGRWVQAEGVVYDNFDQSLNVTEEAEYNPDYGAIYWGVDDGYAYGEGPGTASYHPRVILLAQITPIGGLNIFGEYAKCLELPERSITEVLSLPYPMPDRAYIDSSAVELRARLWGGGIQTVGATHVVTEGIKNLRRLVGDGNGVRLLKIHPRCIGLIREFLTYRYDDSVRAVSGERKPLKQDDHYLDALRYLGWHLARYTMH